jgi:hypothetical protein
MSRAPDHTDIEGLRATLMRCRVAYLEIPPSRRKVRPAVFLDQAIEGLEDAIDALVKMQSMGAVIPFKPGASHVAPS